MPSAPMALPMERKPLPFQLANLGTNSGFEEEILSGCCLYFTRTIKTTTKNSKKTQLLVLSRLPAGWACRSEEQGQK